MTLAGFRDVKDVEADLKRHVSVSFLVWAPTHLLNEFLELAGLPYVTSQTTNFAWTAAIVTGTLADWSNVLEIDRANLEPIFDSIKSEFKLAKITL